MLEAPRFLLQRYILARTQLRVVDLADEMSQVIRATLGLAPPRAERVDVASDAKELLVRGAHARRDRGGRAKGIENRTLRLRIEQRLRLVLSVQAHQRAPHFGEYG